MPHRFFIPSHWIDPPLVTLSGKPARQIKTVLRMKPGDHVIVLDNSGMEWQVGLTEIGRDTVQGQVVSQQAAAGEPKLQLSLYQGTLKAQKFEWVLQKGTELGVSRFVPTVCKRSVVNEVDALAKKRDRWQYIIREAAEQSGRGKLPQLEQAMPLAEALLHTQSDQLVIMPWEKATETNLKQILAGTHVSQVTLIIGPEGGFTAHEADLAQRSGAKLVKLGARILRAETAGIAICAVVLYEMGEWS